jgi:DNA-directed RNA polymerase specialized sigma24 family protein
VDRRSTATSTEPGLIPAPESTGPDVTGPAWRSALAGTPREVLARLVQGDPLGVRGRVARRLRSDALLLDADRIHLCVVARIARSAGRYRGRPGIEEWLDAHVLATIADVVRRDHEVARSPQAFPEESASAFAALAAPLGLDPGGMRRACAAFNVLPQADRAAFVDLVLRDRSLDEMAKESGESATRIARRARRGLDAVLESSAATERPGSPA